MSEIKQIFISYKSEYRPIAIKVRDQLQAWGYQTWMDFEQVHPGEYFRHKIDEGLKSSQIVIGIATPEAVQSREVMWEWDYALSHIRLIPLLYQNFDLPYHLRGTQYIDCTSNEAAAFEKLRQTILNPTTPAPVVSPATKASPPPNNERETMLNLVQSTWVEGVLHATLRENQALNIPRSLAPDRVLQHVDFGEYALPPDADILQIFEDMQRELLILGDPGAGKTILMLQLAEKLVAQAHADPTMPMPVVLNLASWGANPQQSLHDWLIAAMKTVYPISKKLATEWVDGEKILLLLDGLDEVVEDQRNACVDAINTFRRQHKLVDMVVCSRVKDYDTLTNRLDLRGGLLLEGLSDDQIAAYLRDEAYDGLREVMPHDDTLQAFAQTPFLLNMMGLVYHNVSPLGLQLPAQTTRPDDLMERFVNQRLTVVSHKKYTPAQTRHYLTWLAKNMVERDQIIFQVESLQPNWILGRHRWLYRLLLIVLGAMFWGVLMVGIWGVLGFIFFFIIDGSTADYALEKIVNLMPISAFLGALFGVLLGVLGNISKISPIEQLYLRFTWATIKKGAIWGGRLGGLFTVILVIVGGVLGAVLGSTTRDGIIGGMFKGILYGGLLGVLFGVPMGVLGAIFGVLESETIRSKNNINHGIKTSFKNMLLVGVLGVTFGAILIGVIVFWGSSIERLERAVRTSMIIGAPLGGFVGVLRGGGIAVLQHISLRLTLMRSSYTPKNYAEFLTYCTEDLQILRRVGGSFLFRHRTLLEYFAAQYREEDFR